MKVCEQVQRESTKKKKKSMGYEVKPEEMV